jgi:hypothetical protein
VDFLTHVVGDRQCGMTMLELPMEQRAQPMLAYHVEHRAPCRRVQRRHEFAAHVSSVRYQIEQQQSERVGRLAGTPQNLMSIDRQHPMPPATVYQPAGCRAKPNSPKFAACVLGRKVGMPTAIFFLMSNKD